MKWAILFFIILCHFETASAKIKLTTKSAEPGWYDKRPIDIDDMVRAEDDPNFEQYVKARDGREKEIESLGYFEIEKRERFEKEQDRIRQSYVNWRDSQPAKDLEAEERRYQDWLKVEKAWADEHERARRQQVELTRQKEEREQARKMSIFRKVYPNKVLPTNENIERILALKKSTQNQRLPASKKNAK